MRFQLSNPYIAYNGDPHYLGKVATPHSLLAVVDSNYRRLLESRSTYRRVRLSYRSLASAFLRYLSNVCLTFSVFLCRSDNANIQKKSRKQKWIFYFNTFLTLYRLYYILYCTHVCVHKRKRVDRCAFPIHSTNSLLI